MESKYKERATDLISQSDISNESSLVWNRVNDLMCQLAEEVESNNYPKDTYCVVTWSDSQMLFEQEWFNECILINDDKGLEMFGSSAYLVPIDRYNELYNIIKPTLYTKEQVEELLQKQRELCADKTCDCIDDVSCITNSILNAKLKLE